MRSTTATINTSTTTSTTTGTTTRLSSSSRSSRSSSSSSNSCNSSSSSSSSSGSSNSSSSSSSSSNSGDVGSSVSRSSSSSSSSSTSSSTSVRKDIPAFALTREMTGSELTDLREGEYVLYDYDNDERLFLAEVKKVSRCSVTLFFRIDNTVIHLVKTSNAFLYQLRVPK